MEIKKNLVQVLKYSRDAYGADIAIIKSGKIKYMSLMSASIVYHNRQANSRRYK